MSASEDRYGEVVERLKDGQWVREAVEKETGLLDREAVWRVLRTLGEEVGLDLEAAIDLVVQADEYTTEMITDMLQQYAEGQRQPKSPELPPASAIQIEEEAPTQFPALEPEDSALVLSSAPEQSLLPSSVQEQPQVSPDPEIPQEQPSISLNESFPQEAEVTLSIHTVNEEISIVSKLKASIADFEALCKQEGSQEQISAIKAVIRTMKRQLARLTDRPQSPTHASLRFRERCNRTLHDIFHFYSNKILLIGKSPSFDLIQHNSETWNISKFVRFLQDFNLLQAKKSKTLDIPSVKVVFAKNAHAQREMDEEQFHGALGMIADLYYSKEFDEENGLEVAGKRTDEKLEMLYRLLQFDRPNEWMKRAKGFGLPFGSHTKPLPPTYKPTHKQKGPQSHSTDLTIGKRAQTPAKHLADMLVSESSQPTRSEVSVPTKPAPKSKVPFTLKTLSDLKPEDLLGRNEDFDLSGLVAEDSFEEEPVITYTKVASQPVLPPSKSTLLRSDLRYTLTTLPQQLLQKTKVLSQSELRRSQDLLNKSMKLEEAQKERGQRVLDRLRHVSHH